MYLPATKHEMKQLGWDRCDVILVTGDSYIDSPYIGVAVIGKVLTDAGYKVGVIAQPDIGNDKDIQRLGEPALFWGVSGGSVDSMVANYTALKKKRRSDDYTPGGENIRRPDRAVIAYSNLIRRYFKETVPIVIGGIEASLRRIAHYDYWSNKVRGSVLFDAKADYLLYGMAERSIVELAKALAGGKDTDGIKGLCYKSTQMPEGYLKLPELAEVKKDKQQFWKMFQLFYDQNDPITAKGLVQLHDTRYLIQNPPQPYLSQKELDHVSNLTYEYDVHPLDAKQGKVRALETIRFSIKTHQGCYGECNFCSIALHEGRTVRWRSEDSILREAKRIISLPGFKGYLLDAGGPTANMYGFECSKKLKSGACKDQSCIYPEVCKSLKPTHEPYRRLLAKLAKLPGMKKVFVSSGIRYDLLFDDKKGASAFMEQLTAEHVSGQLKIAPEHTDDRVLKNMRKPSFDLTIKFKAWFDHLSRKVNKKQFLTYYFITGYPGCTENNTRAMRKVVSNELKLIPEQVQIFTPTPSTLATAMYYTESDGPNGDPIYVEKDVGKKRRQVDIFQGNEQRERVDQRKRGR
ncbi:MAG: YgiQ family radical SAM protein [Anaerolineaceae bacterium]|nr:YgiQ family radical SAM protein [Anaerolineaceae bacterium]